MSHQNAQSDRDEDTQKVFDRIYHKHHRVSYLVSKKDVSFDAGGLQMCAGLTKPLLFVDHLPEQCYTAYEALLDTMLQHIDRCDEIVFSIGDDIDGETRDWRDVVNDPFMEANVSVLRLAFRRFKRRLPDYIDSLRPLLGWIDWRFVLIVSPVAFTVYLFVAAFQADKKAAQETRDIFMAECLADGRKNYECVALWRAGEVRESTTVVPMPVIVGR